MGKSMEVDGLFVEIERKPIKNIYLKVKGPNGRLIASVPSYLSEEQICSFLESRKDWMKEKLKQYKTELEKIEYRYETGEEHYFLGMAYPFIIVHEKRKIAIDLVDNKIIMNVPEGYSFDKKKDRMNAWYRERLYKELDILIPKWEKIIGVSARETRVRDMKRKWGTCNITDQRIWLNLQLIKKPLDCLEYVVVHELIHLLERDHNDRFFGYMDEFLPDWKERKTKLNEFIKDEYK